MRAPVLFLPAVIAFAALLIACGGQEELVPLTTTPSRLSPSVPSTPTPPALASPTPTAQALPADWTVYVDPQLGFSLQDGHDPAAVDQGVVAHGTGRGYSPHRTMGANCL